MAISKNNTRVYIKIKKTSKEKLETKAKQEGKPFSKYCTQILEEKAEE